MSRKKGKKNDYDVATNMNYGVPSFSCWSKSIGNPETNITRNEVSSKNIASFLKVKHLEWVRTS
jgi:hypothetical protein